MAKSSVDQKKSAAMLRIEARAAEIEAAAVDNADAPASTPRQMFLPGVDDLMRAMPNHLARSSLFAPVARGRKKVHADSVLDSRGDALIRFKGEQLDEAQADVWMQGMFQAIQVPLGQPVVIQRAEFLRSIGRSPSGQNYQWLQRTMEALAFAMLVIEVQTKDGKPKLSIGRNRAIHMFDGFDYDSETEAYILLVDPRWREMYGNKEFALIDWEKRLQFGQGQDMAKALQRLVATSSDQVQRYALDWLKKKLAYESPMRKFREALLSAMHELERLEIIADGSIEKSTKGKEQATWTKLVA